MVLKINIVTDNYYFFVGVKEHLHGNGRVVEKIIPHELKRVYGIRFKEDDVLIFHASNYIDEFLFLISMVPFPGKVIFIPVSDKVRFNLDFKNHIFLYARASIDMIFNEITKGQDNESHAENSIREKLTKREKAILFHTINGMDVQSIGQFLSISKKTVYAHRRNALHKLGGRNLFEIWPMKDHILNSAIF